jgi:hypothetical protein
VWKSSKIQSDAISNDGTNINPDHLAMIAAAAYTTFGTHRILHIEEDQQEGTGWVVEGRLILQTSHSPAVHH